MAVLVWPSDLTQAAAALHASAWPMFGALGVLGAGLSFFLYVAGIRNTRPTVAAMTAMIEPVTASLFGVAILAERLVVPQIIGMGLVLVTVTALSVYSSGRRR